MFFGVFYIVEFLIAYIKGASALYLIQFTDQSYDYLLYTFQNITFSYYTISISIFNAIDRYFQVALTKTTNTID